MGCTFMYFTEWIAKGKIVKKDMPKRARIPPKKMRLYEPDPGSPKDDQDGNWIIVILLHIFLM